MYKILDSEQIKLLDAASIEKQKITSFQLMERAATAIVDCFYSNLPVLSKKMDFVVFCGMGNNGGDGLAIARLLVNKGKNVQVFILKHKEQASSDFEKNFQILKKMELSIQLLNEKLFDFHLPENCIVIDCLFGIGLSRPISGFMKEIIQKINDGDNIVLAIDSPSGLYAEDNSRNDLKAVVKADFTFTIGLPKLSFFFPSNHDYVGHWFIVPLGLDADFIYRADSKYFYLEEKDIVSYLKTRPAFSHKGRFGHSLIIAGSYGKIGAAVLSAKACLRTGVGLLTAAVPKCGYEIMQTSVPEAMVTCSKDKFVLEDIEVSDKYNCVAIGPGIGTSASAELLLMDILKESSKPVILDADALNIVARKPKLLAFIPENSILSPHPGEFERLVGSWKNDYHRLDLLIEFASKYSLFVILKGKYSTLACPSGEIFFNSTGNAGMATAGSGDVLTGILCSLLSQGYTPKIAAIFGMFLHGLAGDMASAEKSQASLIAGDIIEAIPKVYKRLLRQKHQIGRVPIQ